jgi:hypothetical protein
MPITLGTVIAERTLERAGSTRPVRARLGQPRPSRRARWECPYQVVGAGDARVRVGLGEDALQSLLDACVGLRTELARVRASWLSQGVSGIPPFIPDVFGKRFTMHLEAIVEGEVAKLTGKLKRAYEAKQQRLNAQRGKNTSPNRRGLRAGR